MEEFKTWLAAQHDESRKEQSMVYSVWEDGEITLEKGGDLFGCRSCHQIVPPLEGTALAPDAFPVCNGKHGRIFPKDGKHAWEVRDKIAAMFGVTDRYHMLREG